MIEGIDEHLQTVLGACAGRRIVVVGDLLADEYIFGETARVSREAPVLILRRVGSRVIPGGAGNAVLNVKALGGVPVPVSVLGSGEMSAKIISAFRDQGIAVDGILESEDVTTVRKTRIMAGGAHGQKQQVLRLDEEVPATLSAALEERLLRTLASALREADGVLMSDYGYGTLSPRVRSETIATGTQRQLPIGADSRYDLLAFRGITFATPNESEAMDAVRRLGRGAERAEDTALALRAALDSKFLLMTRGQDGMIVAEANGRTETLSIWGSREAADVTGAGDTVAAMVLLATAAGASPGEAASLATVAAGIVVQKHGAATTTPEEMIRVAGIRREVRPA